MKREKYIEDIMENLDWVKIQNVMRFLNWTWFGDDEPPSIAKMMKNVRELIDSLDEHKSKEVGSGGFVVSGDKEHGYSVHFQVSQWDNY